MAKVLSVFDICKPVDEQGHPIEPVVDYIDGTIRLATPLFDLPEFDSDCMIITVIFAVVPSPTAVPSNRVSRRPYL